LKFYKSSLNFSNNIITYKECFLVFRNQSLCIFWFFIFYFWPLLLWKGITFSILFHFWQFLVHQMCQEEGFKFCLNTKNNKAHPLDLAYLECLNAIIATQFATNEQLKDLTHMFCLRISCYKLYKKGLFSYVLTLKYMCQFGMNLKKPNQKAKHKFFIKKFIVIF